jgi:phosphate transport system permease protein
LATTNEDQAMDPQLPTQGLAGRKPEASAPQPRGVAYRRNKETRRAVFIADRLAKRVIRVGGVAVIAAVMGIMVFLIAEVTPLFMGGEILGRSSYALAEPPRLGATTAWDEYRRMATMVSREGAVTAVHAPSGKVLATEDFPFEQTPSANAHILGGSELVFGFPDGSARVVAAGFRNEVLPSGQEPAGLEHLPGGDRTDGEGVFSDVPGGQVRRVFAKRRVEDPIRVTGGLGVRALGMADSGGGQDSTRAFVALDEAGELWLTQARTKKNLMTGALRTKTRTIQLPRVPGLSANPYLLLSRGGRNVIVARRDGTVFRFDTSDLAAPELAETSRLTSPGVGVTALAYLVGEQSLVVGGTDGSVNIHFLLQRDGAGSTDGRRLVRTRDLQPHGAAVTRIVPSGIDKSFLTADASGALWLRHATSDQVLLRFPGEQDAVYGTLALAPRRDGVFAVTEAGEARYWHISVPHPETSWKTFWGRIWYEGYPEPTFTWQSSAATDDFEPKLSLVPLIFGTLKATLYSMLFAVPVALLAAFFVSEFMGGRVKGVLKPAMEMMASLPSVVLGFVAALVLAPLVETWIGSVLLCFLTVPAALVLGAHLWQLLPRNLADHYDGSVKLACIVASLLVGIYAAVLLGSGFERVFFQGSVTRWLSGTEGSGRPLTFLLLLPLSLFGVLAYGARHPVNPCYRRSKDADGLRAGLYSFAGFSLSLAAAGVLAAVAAEVLVRFGFDPRDGLVGTYVQRNTLLIGFAMGFAVIPIVFTIAEDALSAVPDHLRGASLGCGATAWQTTLWVVMPAAMSGIFSAIMVGMGRAVGETMIVVMAAGNTPIMDINPFNGLRALSANIAVELPEAVVGGTLYRTLFLSGLVLFAATFVVNTAAELVRLRYRKKARQL